jgi:hypothetical protein
VKEKLKGSHPDATSIDQQQIRGQQPGAHGAGKEADAIDESGNIEKAKLKDNQERLNVGPDHKTPEMEKRHRGTFP